MQKSKHKKRYSKISVEKRAKLVGLVLQQGLTITKAAKILHVKRPTAKIIIKRYQALGTFFQKKMPQWHGQSPHSSFASQNTLPELPSPSQQIALQEKSVPEVGQTAQEIACQEGSPLPSCLCPQVAFVVCYPPFLHFQCYI